MIDSFVIENFRLFRHLEISRFGQVNLFVGKNNSGKSALLEALELYASNVSLQTIRSLVLGREESWNEKSQSEVQRNPDNPARHLFRGHQLPKFGSEGIKIGSNKNKSDQINIVTAAFHWAFDEEGDPVRRRLSAEELRDSDLEVEYCLIALTENKFRRLAISKFRTVSHPLTEIDPLYSFQTVPTRNMEAQKVALLWDLIGLTSLADEVVDGLKLIEPSIRGILFVENGRQGRIPLASCEGATEPFPLKSMGDGMTRLFHIIVALVNAKNGIVLIDEFENGLHWSVQPSIWKALFRLAKQLNVQVFATTHSRDCVAGFENAWAEYPDQGAFFRLQLNKENEPSIKAYSLETLVDSLDTDVEVR